MYQSPNNEDLSARLCVISIEDTVIPPLGAYKLKPKALLNHLGQLFRAS